MLAKFQPCGHRFHKDCVKRFGRWGADESLDATTIVIRQRGYLDAQCYGGTNFQKCPVCRNKVRAKLIQRVTRKKKKSPVKVEASPTAAEGENDNSNKGEKVDLEEKLDQYAKEKKEKDEREAAALAAEQARIRRSKG